MRSDREAHTYTLLFRNAPYVCYPSIFFCCPLYDPLSPPPHPSLLLPSLPSLPRRRPGWSRRRRRAMLRGVSTKHWRQRWSFASPNSMRNWPTATLIRSRDSTRTTRGASTMLCEWSSILTCYCSVSLLEKRLLKTLSSIYLSQDLICFTLRLFALHSFFPSFHCSTAGSRPRPRPGIRWRWRCGVNWPRRTCVGGRSRRRLRWPSRRRWRRRDPRRRYDFPQCLCYSSINEVFKSQSIFQVSENANLRFFFSRKGGG